MGAGFTLDPDGARVKCCRAIGSSFWPQQVDRVGWLSVGVAHKLNNLLVIIAGNLETLEQRIGNKLSAAPRASRVLRRASR